MIEKLKQRKFEKLTPAEKIAHQKQYAKAKDDMIRQWEENTGQKWPRYPKDMKKLDGSAHRFAGQKHQVHHIVPQEVGGPHEWWNGYPLAQGAAHQGGVHGSGSALNQILKDVRK